jgi:hypothetical protein
MPAPVRPVFKNGQRLTADRLTLALEFLRSWIRRLSLGPLSTGVAAGLTLEPFGDGRGLIVHPGLAIDGRGRLLLLPEPRQFTPDQLSGAVGSIGPGALIRVRLTMIDSGLSADPCADQSTTIVEDVDILVDRDPTPLNDRPNEPSFEGVLNCVAPNDPLDLEVGSDCSVTLGHLLGDTGGVLTATYSRRQAVSPQVGLIRNSLGTGSILLGQMVIEFDGTDNQVEGVAVARPALFSDRARFLGRAIFEDAGGAKVQATRVGPPGDTPSAGTMWGTDNRIFTFPGGAGNVNGGASDQPAGQGGVSAVPCVVGSGPSISRQGVPLEIDSPPGGTFMARVKQATGTASNAIFGISAAKEETVSGNRIVPVAASGLVRVTVAVRGDAIGLGEPLTVDHANGARVKKASSGEYVVGRACSTAGPNPPDTSGVSPTTESQMLVWVVQPSYKHT